MGYRHFALAAIASLLFAGVAAVSHALPFNDDMVSMSSLNPGEIVRGLPEGSVAIGSLRYRLESKADAEKLTNPNAGDPLSAMAGKRLF